MVRAASDDSVHNVFELARQNGLEDVGIICTKSDVSDYQNLLFDMAS